MPYPPVIKEAKNSKDKSVTIAAKRAKLKVALYAKMYGEALGIEYSFFEDRFTSMLYHLGVLTSRSSPEVQPTVLGGSLANVAKPTKDGKPFHANTLHKKQKLVRAVLIKAKSATEEELLALSPIYSALRQKSIPAVRHITVFPRLNQWKQVRNELAHASLTKDYADLRTKEQEYAELGQALCKDVDALCKAIKGAAKLLKTMPNVSNT